MRHRVQGDLVLIGEVVGDAGDTGAMGHRPSRSLEGEGWDGPITPRTVLAPELLEGGDREVGTLALAAPRAQEIESVRRRAPGLEVPAFGVHTERHQAHVLVVAGEQLEVL